MAGACLVRQNKHFFCFGARLVRENKGIPMACLWLVLPAPESIYFYRTFRACGSKTTAKPV